MMILNPTPWLWLLGLILHQLTMTAGQRAEITGDGHDDGDDDDDDDDTSDGPKLASTASSVFRLGRLEAWRGRTDVRDKLRSKNGQQEEREVQGWRDDFEKEGVDKIGRIGNAHHHLTKNKRKLQRVKRRDQCDMSWEPVMKLSWYRGDRNLVVSFCDADRRQPSAAVCYDRKEGGDDCVFVAKPNCEVTFANITDGTYTVTVTSDCCFGLPGCNNWYKGPFELKGSSSEVSPPPTEQSTFDPFQRGVENQTVEDPRVSHSDSGSDLTTPLVVVIGALATSLILLSGSGLLVFLCWRKIRKRETSRRTPSSNKDSSTIPGNEQSTFDQLDQQSMDGSTCHHIQIEYDEEQCCKENLLQGGAKDVESCSEAAIFSSHRGPFHNEGDSNLFAPPYTPKVMYPFPKTLLEKVYKPPLRVVPENAKIPIDFSDNVDPKRLQFPGIPKEDAVSLCSGKCVGQHPLPGGSLSYSAITLETEQC